MSTSFFLLAIGFFLLTVVKNIVWISIIAFLYGYYLFRKLENYRILIVWLLCIVLSFILMPTQIPKPINGIYHIYSVKENYCLARNGEYKVLVYGLTDPNFDDEYYLDSFQEIDSIRNIGQFSFSDYMEKQGICFQVYGNDEGLKEKGWTTRSILYSKVKNHPLSDFYKGIFFGIYTDTMPDIFRRLSLPFVAFISMLERLLNNIFDKKHTNLILFVFIFLYGYHLVFTISLYRLLLNRMAKCLFDDYNARFAFSMFLFILLFPGHTADFSFVFPQIFQFVHHFIHSQKQRWIVTKMLLIMMEFLYFGQVEIISLFLFSFLRKASGYLFAGAFIGVFLSLDILSYFNVLLSLIPKYTIYYYAGLIYICLGCMTMYILLKNVHWIYKMMIILCFVIWPFISCYLDPCFHVYMIDIGQGDCTLIVEPFQRSTVMIDCGQSLYKDNMELNVVPFLRSIHVNHLDCLILTHDDFDHSGGYESLSKQIEIKECIRDSKTEIPVSYPFLSLCPERIAKDENDKSIVSLFEYDGIRYLWMGDASMDVEKQIIKEYPTLKTDILKLGHHGSKTSSSFKFLDEVDPLIGLISVGKHNHYGHPDSIVIQNCAKLQIHVLMTKDVGMVELSSFYGIHWMQSASGLFGLF